MKHYNIFIALFIVILISYGCDSGGGHSGGVGFIPKIKSIQPYNFNDPNNPVMNSFYKVGDQITFNVVAEDTDKNMKILWITEYFGGSTTPYNGPTSFQLPKQPYEQMTYGPIGTQILSGSAGNYIFELQIEDASGNRTEVLRTSITVE